MSIFGYMENYIPFINDLAEVVKGGTIRLFANDVKIFGPVTTPQQRHSLQSGIDQLISWADLWQLPLNIDKCSVVHL